MSPPVTSSLLYSSLNQCTNNDTLPLKGNDSLSNFLPKKTKKSFIKLSSRLSVTNTISEKMKIYRRKDCFQCVAINSSSFFPTLLNMNNDSTLVVCWELDLEETKNENFLKPRLV